MRLKQDRTERKVELLKWSDENKGKVNDLIAFCLPRLRTQSIKDTAEELKERRHGYDCLSVEDITDLLEPYLHPAHYLPFRVTVSLTPETRFMLGNLGADPKEFIEQLLSWYYHESYLNDKGEQESIEQKENEVWRPK